MADYDYRQLIAHAAKSAAEGCGLSDVLFEERFQGRLVSILEDAPEACRAEVLSAVTAAGYDPNFKPYEAGDGECSLTGIDVNWCPCGRHP